MLAVCVVPLVLLVMAADHPTWLTVAGGKDSGFRFDYGLFLSQTPGALATALLAPLVGYRRRVALWFLLPPVNLCFAWITGFLAGQLGAPGARRASDNSPLAAPARGAEDLIREGLKR